MQSLKELTQNAYEKILEAFSRHKLQKIAGCVVYRKEEGVVKYLLLQHRGSHWDFSKGKVEPDEQLISAARRELYEETGLKKGTFKNGFMETIRYSAKNKRGKKINKVGFFYLVRVFKKDIKLSKEHKDYEWVGYQKALKLATFKNARLLLKKANKYINNKQ